MPELTVLIGDVAFDVACKDGEEGFLKTAAAMLDTEAKALKSALGRIPENRMLLMSGLMLADKTASLEDELKKFTETSDDGKQKRIDQAEAVLQDTLAELGKLKAAEAERTEALKASQARVAELEAGTPASSQDSEGSSELADLKEALEAEKAAHAATRAEAEKTKEDAESAADLQTKLSGIQLSLAAEKAAHSATKIDKDEAFDAARQIAEKLAKTAEAVKSA